MEITTKFRIGKLPEAGLLALNFERHVAAENFQQLDISVEHAALAGSLDIAHKDPFDRLLIAQAKLENLTLVSNEEIFDNFGVWRIW